MEKQKLITAEDLYGFRWVSDPQISPDGGQVAYVLTHIDENSDEYRSAIYTVPSDGSSEPRRMTYGPKRDQSPRWSPDGKKLLFVSDREGKPQLYLMPLDGGEPWALPPVQNGVGEPEWGPDGRSVAFISTVGCSVEDKPEDIVAYYYTEAHFKGDGEGIKRGRRHLFVQDVEGGEAVQLTFGEEDYFSPVWSPDAAHIAVVAAGGFNRAYFNLSDIYLVPATGGEPRRVTPNKGPSVSPAFSPDGSKLAFLGHQNPPETGLSTQVGLWTAPVEGGAPRELTGEWDRSTSNDVNSDSRWGSNYLRPVWSADGDKLYFVGDDTGTAHIYSVPAQGGAVQQVTSGERVVDVFSISDDRLVYLAAEMLNPGDLYSSALDGAGETRLTRVNEEFLSEFALSRPEEIRFPSTEGATVHGWVMKPARYRDGEKHPLVLEVHGGPHTLYGHAFFHEFQVLAARGYGVLFTNPRGSTGYGQEFTACIVKDWGVRDYEDIMAAADWAEQQSWVDPQRLGITGGSYGGYMTSWAIGHTDRFRAAVTQRSLTNWSSFYGTSDIGAVFSEWHVGGAPWTNPEGYARMSPITYIQNMHTPLLISHSEEDHRCPVEQAEQLFVGLERLGCEVEFLRFPKEAHGLSRGGKPKRRIERINRIAGWFERYMPANGVSTAEGAEARMNR